MRAEVAEVPAVPAAGLDHVLGLTRVVRWVLAEVPHQRLARRVLVPRQRAVRVAALEVRRPVCDLRRVSVAVLGKVSSPPRRRGVRVPTDGADVHGRVLLPLQAVAVEVEEPAAEEVRPPLPSVPATVTAPAGTPAAAAALVVAPPSSAATLTAAAVEVWPRLFLDAEVSPPAAPATPIVWRAVRVGPSAAAAALSSPTAAAEEAAACPPPAAGRRGPAAAAGGERHVPRLRVAEPEAEEPSEPEASRAPGPVRGPPLLPLRADGQAAGPVQQQRAPAAPAPSAGVAGGPGHAPPPAPDERAARVGLAGVVAAEQGAAAGERAAGGADAVGRAAERAGQVARERAQEEPEQGEEEKEEEPEEQEAAAQASAGRAGLGVEFETLVQGPVEVKQQPRAGPGPKIEARAEAEREAQGPDDVRAPLALLEPSDRAQVVEVGPKVDDFPRVRPSSRPPPSSPLFFSLFFFAFPVCFSNFSFPFFLSFSFVPTEAGARAAA